MKRTNTIRFSKDLLQSYMNEVANSQPLSAKEEAVLACRIQAGDIAARDQLVEANLRFVIRVAREYQNREVPLSDLISAGNVGLITAAERFDETRGVKFITYAVWWIRQSILQTLSEHSRTVRLPSNRVELLNKITRCASTIRGESPDQVPVEQIAEELEIPEAQVVDVLSSGQPTISLDTKFREDDEHSMLDMMMDEEQESPDIQVLKGSLKAEVASVLGTLDQREEKVIRLYFGLDEDEDEMTLEAIGTSFGLTRERVRQIKERALNKLRHPGSGQRLLHYADGY
jgi:RNA polymerase primary sigma factor